MEAKTAWRFVVSSVREGFNLLHTQAGADRAEVPDCLRPYADARARRAERKLAARLTPFSAGRFAASLLLCLSLLVGTSPVMAVSGDVPSNYTGGGTATAPLTGTWNNAANWDVLPTSLNTTELDFGGSGSTAYTSTNDFAGTFTLNAMVLNSSATVTEAIAGNALSFATNATSVLPSIVQSGTGAFTISNNLALANNFTFSSTNASAGNVALTGIISGTGTSLTLSGTGANLTLSGANTYTGGTILNAGTTLNIGSATAIGTGLLTINGGTLTNSTAGAITLSSNNAQSWAGDFSFTGTSALNLGTGAVALTANRQVTVNGAGALTVGGVVSGAFGLTVGSTGTGTLVLSGANTFTGTTTVNSGATLKLGNASALGTTTTSAVTVNAGGTLDIGGFNALNQKSVTISGNGVGGVGAYINSSTTDITNGVQTLVLAGNSTVGGAGRLDIRGNGGTATFNMGGFTLNTQMTGGKYFALVGTTVSNPGAINVNTGGLDIEGATNMAGNVTNRVNVANGAYVNYFSFTGTDAWTHNMAGGSNMRTNNNSGVTSTVAGQWVLQGAVSATPGTNDTLVLNGLVYGPGSLTVNGGGTLNLNTTNAYAGPTTLSSSTLNLNAAGASGYGNFIQTGGTLNESVANGFQGTTALTLSGGTTNLSQVNINSGGAAISGTNVTTVSAAGGLSGPVTISGGTLISSVTSGAANSGTITGTGGVITSALAGGLFQNVTLNGGTINPGGVGTVGSGALSINNLTTTGGTLQFDSIGTVANTDLLNVLGTLTVGAGTNIGFGAGRPSTPGNYKLIQFTGGAPNLANFVLPTAPSGVTYSLSTATDPGFIDLIVSGAQSLVTGNWIPTAASSFSWNSGANWVGGVVPSASGDSATFNTALAGNQTVTLDAGQRVGSLTLNPTTTFSYTITAGTGGALFLDNGASAASITNTNGNNTISAPITLVSANTNVNVASGKTLTVSGLVSGNGSITLNGGTGNLALTNTGNNFTGTINLLQGTLQASNDAVFGNATNGIVLNGGTLSQNATTSTLTLGGLRTLTVGASGGTIDIQTVAAANPSTSKILANTQNASILQGSGTITKTGNGDFQLGGSEANTGFSGNWVINGGVVEAQNPLSLGVGGSVTVNTGGELVSTSTWLANNLVLAGGTISANGGGTAVYSGNLNVTANSTIAARLFQTPTTANNLSFSGALSGSGNLALTTGTSSTAIVGLAGGAGYTGAITVGNLVDLGIVSGGQYGTGITVNSGGTILLASDGTELGTPGTTNYTLTTTPITFNSGSLGYAVGRAGFGLNGGRTNLSALNQTISVADLPLNNTAASTLNVTPVNGYGLALTAPAALTANTTYNVAGTQASNVVPGLTVSNLGGAGFNVTKTNTGTLVLGGTNTFGGVGNFVDIVQGVVAGATEGAFGDSNNLIKLDATGTNTATLRGIGNFTTAREIDFNSTNSGSNIIEVSNGNTMTLTGVLKAGAAANNITKGENGTLVLSNTVSGAWTGGLQIFQGAVQLTSSTGTAGVGALGNAPVSILGGAGQGQAALQLNPGVSGSMTVSNAINLNPTGNNIVFGGINFGGQVESITGTNTLSGTISLAADSGIGVDNGSTLNINGIAGMTTTTTRALQLITQAGGTMNLNGNIATGTAASYFGINKYGAGTLNITAAQSGAITSQSGTGSFGIHGGTVNLTNAGTLGGAYTNGIGINYGSTLNLDNTAAALSNRLGNGTNLVTFTGGTLSLLGNTGSTVSETLKSITLGRGENVFSVGLQSGDAAGQANLTLTATGGAFTRNVLGSTLFQSASGTTLGTAAGAGLATINTGAIAPTFQGAGTTANETTAGGGIANYGILPWAVVNNNGTITLATTTTLGANGFVRNLTAGETVGSFANTAAQLGTFTNATNQVTLGDATGLFVGEAVTGAGIAANSYITNISGTTITLNANVTADSAAGGNALVFSTTGTNISLSSTAGPLPASVLNQSVNSLTLQSGGNLNLFANAPQTITLGGGAGGAILATGASNTISGGIITAGANELIVHAVGNLTINSAITGGATGAGVGLTKGENGTLTLGGNAFYGGQTVINAGTLKLASTGTANTIWYQNYLELGPTATLDLNGHTQWVTDLFNDSLVDATTTGGSIINSSGSPATLVLNRDASNRVWSGNIGGNVNLFRSGSNANTWTVTGANTTTGNVLLNDGTTILRDNGSFLNISSLAVQYANLTFDQNGTNDLQQRLSPTLPISLRGGVLSYLGRVQGQGKMNLGAVTVAEGVSDIVAAAGGTGINSVDLTIADLIQGSRDAALNFRTVNGQIGSAARLMISSYEGNTPAKSTVNNLLGGWAVTGGNEFATYIPGLGVASLNATGAAGYDWSVMPGVSNVATQNVRLTTSNFFPTGGLNANSLNLENGGAITLTFGNGTAGVTDALNLTSGGLLKGQAQNTTIGAVVDNGVITAGGVGAVGPQTLYVHNNNGGTFTINSRITDNGSAPVRAVFTQYNAGNTVLADPNNSYTGGTVVNGWVSGGTGVLTIGATGKLPAGGLTMNGANVTQTAGGVIDPSTVVTINGFGTLTLAGNNSLAGLVLNSSGGGVSAGAAPTVATGGLLNLPAGSTVTATNSDLGHLATISGTLGFSGGVGNINVSPTSSTFATAVSPLLAGLNISAAITNATSLNVSGGGVLQLSGASTFNGGVNLAAGTALLLSTSSSVITNSSNSVPLSGPLGTGILSIGTNSRILTSVTTSVSLANAALLPTAFTFDSATSVANTLTLGAGMQTTQVNAAGTTINVNAPQMTAALGGMLVGTGAITKTGLGNLSLAGQYNSGFSGGVVLNNGTLTGASNTYSPFGTGGIAVNGGLLQLRSSPGNISGIVNNTPINWGNNVTINSSLASAFIDINNNGGSYAGNVFVMGSLNYTGATTPSTILNITGGNNYAIQFTGTNLNSFSGPVTMNVGSGLSLILPGGLNNLPTNIGQGSLLFSGNNNVAAPTINPGQTLAAAPTANLNTNTPLGTGTLTLAGGTLQVAPVAGTLSSTGYTAGGLTGKYYFTGQTTSLAAPNWGVAPGGVVGGVLPNDVAFRAYPQTIENATGPTQTSLATYSGLLNITTGGTYTFGGGSDDQLQIIVDGQAVVTDNGTGHGLNQVTPGSINLSAGLHQIDIRGFNNGGGGGLNAFYSGPDTVASGYGGGFVNSLQAIPLNQTFYATGAPTAANNYLNSAILNNDLSVTTSSTVDMLGSAFNAGVKTLNIGAGGVNLTVANGNGTTQLGTGIFTVTGATTFNDGSAVINTSTGTLNLAGGVVDNGAGFTKIGNGTLILGNNGSPNNTTFTGNLNLNQGFVQLSDAGGLGGGTSTVGTFQTQSTTTNATTTVTVADTSTLFVGELVIGTGIPANATIVSINTSNNTIVLSAAATASGTPTLTFASPATLDLSGVTGTTATATVLLNGGAGPVAKTSNVGGGIYNSSINTATLSSALQIGTAINGVNPTVSGFGNIVITGAISDGVAGQAWQKTGVDTLTLTNAGNSFTGPLTVAGGILKMGASDVLGGAGALTVSSGATLDLAGFNATGKAITLNGAGNTGTPNTNTLGALINSSATTASTVGGAVTLAANSSVGNASFTPGAFNVTTPSAGDITIGGVVSGAFTLTKVGGDNLFLTNAANTVTALTVNGGNVVFNGSGALTVVAGTNQINPTAGLYLDNSTAAVNNRLGGRGLWENGNFTIIGNATTGVTESITNSGSNVALGNGFTGQGIITLDASKGGFVDLAVNSTVTTSTTIINRSVAGSTLLIRGTALGTAAAGTAGTAGFYGQGTSTIAGTIIGNTPLNIALPNRGVLPWAIVDNTATGNGISLATYDATKGFQALNATDVSNVLKSAFAQAGSTVTTTSTTITLTTGSTSTLLPGELVSGTGIPAGAYIASITDATHYVLSATPTTAGTNVNLTYTPDFNISTGATGLTAPAGTLTQINSLTMGATGGGVTIGAGTFLALDSGGVLGIGNTSISGAGTLTATNTANREMIFHTPNPNGGGTTTLAVNSAIFSQAGLTKADGGTLALGNATTVFGAITLNGGTTKLNANGQGANTIFPLLSTVSTSSNGNGVPNTVFVVNAGATLDLNGANQAVQTLTSNGGTPASGLPLTGGTVTNTASGSPVNLDMVIGQNAFWSGNITGNLNVIRDGGNTWTVNSPNTFTGSFTTMGGNTVLTDLGTLASASSINIKRAGLAWTDSGAQAISNRLGSAPIFMDGGALVLNPRASAGYNNADNITAGAITLNSGASLIQLNGGNGTAPQLTIPGLPTRSLGATLTFGTNAGMPGDNPFLKFTAPASNVNGMLPAWFTVSGSIDPLTSGGNVEFAAYDPATGVHALEYPTPLFGTGLNTRLSASATLAAGGMTSNSLTLSNGAVTVNFANAADTLTLQSGGLLSGQDANSRNIGTTALPGQLTTTNGQNELFIYNASANTLTVNSKIIDNGSNALSVVLGSGLLSANGGTVPTVTFANANTYAGTTFVNGVGLTLNNTVANNPGFAVPGNIVISGGATNGGGDSLSALNTFVQLSQSNQINPASNITMNGASLLQLNSNTQTINNLTFKDDGGTNTNNGPLVMTGTTALTVTGAISSQTPQTRSEQPLINGLLTLNGSGAQTINADANVFQPLQISLAINAAITANSTASSINKTGTGYLGLGGQNRFAGAMNVTGGGVAFVSSGAPLYVGDINLGGGTILDARGLTGTVGSIAGSGTVQNFSQGTAGTVVTGLDNTSTAFSGTFNTPSATALLNVTKIGTGTWALTGDSSATNNGTLSVQGGNVTLGGASGKLDFGTIAVATGSTFTLDNSATAVNNRLGGQFLLGSALVFANTTNHNLNMNGGEFVINGNASTAVAEQLGTLNSVTGGGIITLNAAGTAGVTVNLASWGATQGQQTSGLIRGTNLGTATVGGVAAAGNAAFVVATVPQLAGGGGANGTTNMSVRPDFLADNSATGLGSGFLTKDSVTGQLRPIVFGTETLGSFSATASTNVGLTTLTNVAASTTPGTITLNATGGVKYGIVSNNPWGADGTLLKTTVSNGGVLALGNNTNTGFTGGEFVGSGVTVDFHVVGAGNTLVMNTPMAISASFVKADDGTLVLQQKYYETNNSANRTVGINGGTLQLAAGANTLWTTPGTAIPLVSSLNIGKGTLDLNGNNQVLGSITTSNTTPFAGGTSAAPNAVITNSQSNFVNLVNDNIATGNSTFGGVISGNINFYKQQASNNQVTMTIASPQTYTGQTFVQNGSLALKDQGALVNTSAINLLYAGLILDNTGLADSVTRVSSSTPINMQGGAITLNGTQANDLVNLGAVNVNQGYNFMTAAYYAGTVNSGGVVQLNMNSLNVTNNAVVNFNNTGGALGGTNNNPRVTVASAVPVVNGVVNWAIANNADLATYSTATGFAAATYTTTTLSAGVQTDNVNVTTNSLAITGRTINALRVNIGGGMTIGLNDPTQLLNVNSGAALFSTTATANVGYNVLGGQLTAGGASAAPSSLYLDTLFNNGNTAGTATVTVSSQIVNNPNGGAVSLVRSGGGTLVLSPTISDTVATVSSTSNQITVPNAAGLFVGMTANGTGIAGSTVTAIAGNVITLSANPTATTTTGVQVSFTAPTVANQNVTQGSNQFTLSGAPAGFTPTVGMAVGGPAVPGGTTITAVAGSLITLSNSFLSTATNSSVTMGALSNTYTGGTFNNGGGSIFGALNLSGQPGSVVIPGDLTIGNTGVNMLTNQGQIASTANVNFVGGGTLTLTGSNTLNSVSFNMVGTSGGNGSVNIVAGQTLNLSSATAVNANNDIYGVLPSIQNGTLNFTSATGTTLNVTGLSSENLLISSVIGASTGDITKTGTGALVLSGANTFSNNFRLTQGSLVLSNAAALGTSNLVLSNGVTLIGALANATPVAINNVVQFAGTNPTINFGGTANTASINNAVNLTGLIQLGANTPTFNVVGDIMTDSLTGTISGTAGFTKSGPGALAVAGNNSATLLGTINVNQGLLALGNASALGSASVDVAIAAPAALNINALNATIGSLSGAGLVTNSGAAATLTVGGGSNVNNTTFSGIITAATLGNLALTKTGTNTFTLNNANLFTGATTVNGGTLALQNNTGSPTGSTLSNTAITVASGTLAPTIGAGSASTVSVGLTAASVNLQAGASASGSLDLRDSQLGTFNINQAAASTGLTIGSATAAQVPANLFFDINGTNSDKVTVGGIASVGTGTGGLINVNVLPATTLNPAQTYTLITGATGSNLNSANLAIAPASFAGLTFLNGSQIVAPSLATSTATASILSFAPAAATPTTAYFTGAQGSNWTSFTTTGTTVNTSFSSDQPGAVDTHQLPGATTDVFVGADNNTTLTTALNAGFTVHSVTFGGTGNGAGSTINSGTGANTLTVGAGGITANTGTNVVNVPVVLAADQTWTNNSASPITFNGSVTGTGALSTAGTGTTVLTSVTLGNVNVTGGTLQYGTTAAGATTPISISNTLSVANGAAAKFASTPGGLNTNSAPSGVNHVVNNLSIAGGGILDLQNHNMITNTPVATVQQYLANGYNNGNWNGANNAGGVGAIQSSTATAAPSNNARSIGYASSADVAAGLVSPGSASLIGANQTLLKYTTPGDFNLSGGTDFNDFLSLQNNYNKPGGWAKGDSNFDGVTNFNDFLILQNNYNHSLPPAAGPVIGGSVSVQSAAAPASGASTGAAPVASIVKTSAVSVSNSLTGTPTITYILSKNDDGTGHFAAGKYAVYAVDSTADGNKGINAYAFDLKGFNTTTGGLVNQGPRGTYDDGTGSGGTVTEGFTVNRSNNLINPVTGSQDKINVGAAVIVYGFGQTAGNLDTLSATYGAQGAFPPRTQVAYNGASTFQVNGSTFQSGLLLATGTFSGDGSALLWNSNTVNDNGNVYDGTFDIQGLPQTVAASIQLQTQDLNGVPEPVSLSLLALGAMGLLARRRRAMTVQAEEPRNG